MGGIQMKKICAILFLALIFILGVGTAVRIGLHTLPEYLSKGDSLPSVAMSFLIDAEYNLQQQIPRKGNWIDLFGGFMRATGTDVVSDVAPIYTVYKMKNGSFAFIHTEENTPLSEDQMTSIEGLKRAADAVGAKSWFISIPQKTCTRDEALAFVSRGVTDNVESIDATRRQAFESCGYSVLDLHEKMHEQPGLHAQLYFKTDHHWTAHAGLWAAGQIAQALSLPTAQLDASQFSEQVRPRAMFGSEGQRCGRLYCPPEDFSIPIPTADTAFTVRIDDEPEKTGSFEETMLFPERLEGNAYDIIPYDLFLRGNYEHISIRNDKNPDGARVLLIKDSFSNVVAPYLSLVCAQLDVVDIRFYEGELSDLIRESRPDVVLVSVTASIRNPNFIFTHKGSDS